MKLWIDADAVPVANQWTSTPMDHPFVTAVRVAGGPDVADRHIAEHTEPGDIAATTDISLAARLIEKQVTGGQEYDEENVGERLAMRDFVDDLRGAGVETFSPRPYGPKDRQAFAAALSRALTRALKGRT